MAYTQTYDPGVVKAISDDFSTSRKKIQMQSKEEGRATLRYDREEKTVTEKEAWIIAAQHIAAYYVPVHFDDKAGTLSLPPIVLQQCQSAYVAASSALFTAPATTAVPEMNFCGSYPVRYLTTSIIKQFSIKYYDSNGDVEAHLLPYYTGFDNSFNASAIDLKTCELFLHIFNFGKTKSATIDGIFQGMHVSLTIPPLKRVIFGPIPRASLQADEGKVINIIELDSAKSTLKPI